MKLIFFDFDGVLVDTLSVCFSLNKKVESTLSLEEYKSFFDGNIYDAMSSGKKKHVPDFDENYKIRTRELKIPLELKKIVQDLSLNYIIAIVSSTPSSSIKDILSREHISSYFADVLGPEVNKSKIIKIKILLEKYRINPDDTVFITDTVGDIIEARGCGVKAIAVTWGFHDKETLENENPVKVASTPEELLEAIKETLNG